MSISLVKLSISKDTFIRSYSPKRFKASPFLVVTEGVAEENIYWSAYVAKYAGLTREITFILTCQAVVLLCIAYG